MSQASYSFFKYSKTKRLTLNCYSNFLYVYNDREEIEKHFIELRCKWERAKQVCMNDGWFNSMFKSIEKLDMDRDGMMLVDTLPIKLLFDPDESHLNEIEFNNYWNQSDERYLQQYVDKFEKEYSNIQQKLEQQGKQMRQLKVVEQHGFNAVFEGPSYILAEHLDLHFITIDLDKNWLSPQHHPYMRKLTCRYDIEFENIYVKQESNLDKRNNINIETLRLMNFDEDSSCDICNNKVVIESLNLQNSLKNLMLYIDFGSMRDENLTQWENVIEISIIKKEYFYKLENVIIVLEIAHYHTDWIWKMLKKNVQLLKYQFKQFIIGWNVHDRHYNVLEWNKQIDTKYLGQLKALYKQNNEQQGIQKQIEEKYLLLIDEWSN